MEYTVEVLRAYTNYLGLAKKVTNKLTADECMEIISDYCAEDKLDKFAKYYEEQELIKKINAVYRELKRMR